MLAYSLWVHIYSFFGHICRPWGYWPVTRVILCGEFASSRFGGGAIVEGVFHPTRQVTRFSPPNVPFILDLFIISLRGKVVNYSPFASRSFEVASQVTKMKFRPLLDFVVLSSISKLLNYISTRSSLLVYR